VDDVLAAGGDDHLPSPGRHRALVGLVLVLVLLAGAADRWQGSRERAELLRSVTAGERAIEASQSSLLSLAAYSAGLLYSADVPDPVRASAYENLAQDAERWRPRLQRARSEVVATPVLPWHRDARAARRAYEQRLTAWIDLLGNFRASPQGGLSDGDTAVTASRQAAGRALVAAGMDRGRIRALLG
jgi:type II secretory pathway pseudopilin PulG